MRAFLRGLRFGMMLQLSVGPVCLFVLQTASAHGFFQGMAAVVGVVAVDGLYVGLAIMGMGALLRREEIRKVVLAIGAAALFLFGLEDILSAFGIPLIPSLGLADGAAGAGPSLYAMLLTASNPLTILFWSGVFASEAGKAEGRPPLFGVGCACATAIFLAAVSVIGSLVARRELHRRGIAQMARRHRWHRSRRAWRTASPYIECFYGVGPSFGTYGIRASAHVDQRGTTTMRHGANGKVRLALARALRCALASVSVSSRDSDKRLREG